MMIDWFTVGAQALNFLILVWLLRRFLYRPVLNAIDAREERIARELADADETRVAAQEERDEFRRKNEEFDHQRATLLSQATNEARAGRQQILDEALKAAEALSARRKETLRDEARHLNQAVSRRTQHEVFAIARKALTDLAATGLEERMVDVFTRRLREMDGEAKASLAAVVGGPIEPALVRSAFDLPAEQRAAIQKALNETFSAEVHLRYETAPDLISGIELTAKGQKIAWSITGYLASMETGVSELLQEKGTSKVNVEPGQAEPGTPGTANESRA